MTVKRKIHKAIITGPTGTIGNTLIELLLKKRTEVYAIVRPESKRVNTLGTECSETEREHLHIIPCDASDYSSLPGKIPGSADAFFHLAWAHTIGAGRNDMSSQIDNIRYAVDAVKAASALKCKVFVGAGSQAECGRVEGLLQPDTPCFPENGYGMAKLCAGEMTRVECEKYGIDHIWMRILSIYGPHDGPNTMIMSTIRALLNGEMPALTAGEQMWDYLYSKDAARGFLAAAESGGNGRVYPLGSGIVRELKEYVSILRDTVDPNLLLNFGKIPYAPKQVMHLQADISSLKTDTGFEPIYSFEEGIKETIEWVKANG